jgi:protein AFG1
LQYDPDAEEQQQEQCTNEDEQRPSDRDSNTTIGISVPVIREIQVEDGQKKRALVPRGLYLYGDVGCGKSFLMDLFYDSVSIRRKRRVHFHSFMNDVHQRIHKLKQLDLQLHGRNFHVETELRKNPIYRVAKQISNEVKLLCFDEFQVTDVADALILSQLFTVLFQKGTVVVATGNRAPQDLYENGINRSYFLPFIALLERHCIVHHMTGTTDYRAVMAEGVDTFFFINNTQSGDDTTNDLGEQIFEFLISCRDGSFNDGIAAITTTDLIVAPNRSLKILQSSEGVCRVHFDDICKANLGASDYRVLAQRFSTICLEGIPKLSVKDHDYARRFITLVDELYEARCALVCFADSLPQDLYQQHDQQANFQDVMESTNSPDVNENLADITELTPGEIFDVFRSQVNGKTVGELASVIELSFAFRRASSRLMEMCSRSYWERFAHPSKQLCKELLYKIAAHSVN